MAIAETQIVTLEDLLFIYFNWRTSWQYRTEQSRRPAKDKGPQ